MFGYGLCLVKILVSEFKLAARAHHDDQFFCIVQAQNEDPATYTLHFIIITLLDIH